MSQEEKIQPPLEYGPYVATAVFAERVLEEKDGVNSLIRIVDRVQIAVKMPKEKDERPIVRHNLLLYLSLKCGQERGSYQLEFQPIKPDGERLSIMKQSVHFEGPDYRGVNIIIRATIDIDKEGTWWFEIKHRGSILTKVPLDVIYAVQTSV